MGRARAARTRLEELSGNLRFLCRLIAHVANRHNALTVAGAHLYFWSRVVYLPVYAAGTPYIRSGIWFVSVIGIFTIFAGLRWP
jgi:uncharacterized MAPEG superfamily protein